MREEIFHNIYYATFICRRPIKMSPLCQLQMTLEGDRSRLRRVYRRPDDREALAADQASPNAFPGDFRGVSGVTVRIAQRSARCWVR